MKCTDPDCPCMEHKTPETHVACCNLHNTPLEPAEAGYGYCSQQLRWRTGRTWHAAPCGAREMRGAVWLPRLLFNQSDLPRKPAQADLAQPLPTEAEGGES